MKVTRGYTMGARADRVSATRDRILQAVLALSEEHVSIDITLDQVADRAEVSVQTVLRHFGTREQLFDSAVAAAQEVVGDERRATPGDVKAAVHAVVGHYERRGDFVVRMLGQSFADARIRSFLEPGKRLHRRWVHDVFRPQLELRSRVDQQTLTDLLVVATDVYTWQLLRRDRKLSRVQVESRMRRLVHAILETKERRSP